MKPCLLLLAGLAFHLAGTAHAQGPRSASAYDCQPLTALNKFECCNAPDWREIILPGSHERCGRDDGNVEVDDAVGSITRPDANPPGPPDDGPPGTEPPVVKPPNTGLGNPGNHKDVGKAGEKNMANEGVPPDDPSYGTRGNSNGEADGNPSGVKHGQGSGN